MRSRARFAVLLTTASIAFAACSGGGSSPSPSSASSAAPPPSTAASAPASQANTEPVTIDWWHIKNNDPGKSLWQKMADEFHAAHPNVTIKITVLENDTFKPKLQTEIQGGNVPDLFQSWGGGGMAEQVRGRSAQGHHGGRRQSWKDTINPGALGMYQYQGKQYGIPYDLGMVGVWYNKDLFQQAGITAPRRDLG